MSARQAELMDALYRAFYKKLFIYAVSALEDSERAKDVVQDTFHEALLHIDVISAHENPGGWLMAALKNKIRESERARRRYLYRFFSLDSDIPAAALPEALISGIQEPDDGPVMERIEGALTPEEYKLLMRFALDKASHLKIAEEFGISVYASQKRLERIRDKLYRLFPERKRKKKK